MPSPTNGQLAPPEEDTTLADPNNPFTPTATSTQGLWKMKSGRINGTGFPPSLANTTTLKLDGENFKRLQHREADVLTPLLLLGRRRGWGMRRCVLF